MTVQADVGGAYKSTLTEAEMWRRYPAKLRIYWKVVSVTRRIDCLNKYTSCRVWCEAGPCRGVFYVVGTWTTITNNKFRGRSYGPLVFESYDDAKEFVLETHGSVSDKILPCIVRRPRRNLPPMIREGRHTLSGEFEFEWGDWPPGTVMCTAVKILTDDAQEVQWIRKTELSRRLKRTRKARS